MYSKVIIVMLVFLIVVIPIYAELSCELTTTCSDYDILHISNITNAHAELPNFNNSNYKVCCMDTGVQSESIETDCAGFNYLKLSDSYDAQAEKVGYGSYPVSACIDINNSLEYCEYVNGSCSAWDTCLVSIHYDTNAHLGECGTYDTSVCCRMTYANEAPVVNDIFVEALAEPGQDMRIYCNITDDIWNSTGVTARLYLKTFNATTWDRIDYAPMEHDIIFFYDWTVTDVGNTEYEARCVAYDGYNSSERNETKFISNGTIVKIIGDWDSDGVVDSDDTMSGDINEVESDVPLTIEVDGSIADNPSGVKLVEFTDTRDGNVFVYFDYDFDSAPLNLDNMSISKNELVKGGVLVKGMEGINKTIRVPKIMGLDKLCIKDASIDNLTEFTSVCIGNDEILFENCNVSGETIGDISCIDQGDYYEVSGLMHSAAIESGETSLEIWSGGDILLTPTKFYANYSNATVGTPIIGADCLIKFDDTGWLTMNYQDPFYNYSRIYNESGTRQYTINCSHVSFDNLTVSDTFWMSHSAVPEFSTLTAIFSMLMIIAVIILRRRKE